jgi:DNA polymerase/3'-5' exonuclease PolX
MNKKCPDNKIYNPLTKRCVSINGIIGKQLMKSPKDLKNSIIKHLSTIRDYERINNNYFKARAYTSVLAQLYAYKEPIRNYEDFELNIKAGDKIKAKVDELIKTGIIKYEEEKIRKDADYYFQQELRKIYGVGDAKIKDLLKAGIKSIDDLKKNQHLLNEKQKIGLLYYLDLDKKIPLDEYILHKKILEKDFKEAGLTYEFVGSFRRGSSLMGDIDILIMQNDKFDLVSYVNKLKARGYIKEILVNGKIKFSGIIKLKDYPARQVDILISSPEKYYYSLLYFTGSAEFNVGLRNYIKNKYDISLSEHGFKENIIKIPMMKSEKDIFSFFNIKYVEPEKRKVFYSPTS